MSEKTETTKGEAVLNTFMTMLIILVYSLFMTHGCTSDAWQREAVQNKAAEWKANPETFRPEFKWKEPGPCPTCPGAKK